MKLHALVGGLFMAGAAAQAGATVLQVRQKGVPTAKLVERGVAFRDLARESELTFVVNDDVDAALALDADGVHLGQGDDGAERAIAAGLLVGVSAATTEQAREAMSLGAGYIGAGPVWATPSKTDAEPAIGLDGLAAICDAVQIPVVAIGGVDRSNAAECIRAGAVGVAVIRAAEDAAALVAAIDAAR